MSPTASVERARSSRGRSAGFLADLAAFASLLLEPAGEARRPVEDDGAVEEGARPLSPPSSATEAVPPFFEASALPTAFAAFAAAAAAEALSLDDTDLASDRRRCSLRSLRDSTATPTSSATMTEQAMPMTSQAHQCSFGLGFW